MIEIAALLSAAVQHWADFAIIIVMLLLNAGVGFWQEFKADSSIAALKQRLALMARGLRDGRWRKVPAHELVLDDVVLIRLGNIVPADVRLVGNGYLSVDQSALAGESLTVSRQRGRYILCCKRNSYAFGRLKKQAASSSTEHVQEPSRTSIPAARNFRFSGSPMKPQTS